MCFYQLFKTRIYFYLKFLDEYGRDRVSSSQMSTCPYLIKYNNWTKSNRMNSINWYFYFWNFSEMLRLLLIYLKTIEHMNYLIVKRMMKILQNIQQHGMKCSMFVYIFSISLLYLLFKFRLFENILSMNYPVFEQNQQKSHHLISNIKKHLNYSKLL